ARIQAMATPIGKLVATVTDQMRREFPNDRSKPGRWNAFCQWRKPQLRGSTNQSAAVLKLLIKSRMTGQMRKEPNNNSTAAMTKWPVLKRGTRERAISIWPAAVERSMILLSRLVSLYSRV